MNIHQEYQYLNLIRNIISNGDKLKTRNGTVLSQFGSSMRFSLKNNEGNNIIPFLTTKRLAWKTCSRELFWFMRGETNNELLREQKVHIWDGNSTREFLDSRGLNYPEHILGPVYGWQWRNFNGKYPTMNNNDNNNISEINNPFQNNENNPNDQLQNVINALKNRDLENGKENFHSRRLIVSAWNPNQINEMALPPCHVLYQFYVSSDNKLSCSMYQRSGDVGLGVPFNIASYSLLTHIIAKHCDLDVGEFVYFLGNAHIYEEHTEALLKQIERTPYDFPQISVKNKYDNINDYSLDDIEITNYKYHPTIKMDMKA